MNDFREWLQQEIDKRNWSMSDLARNAGIARGSVANVLRGERNPGVDLCEAIARALKISPEVVYRHAGLLPPELKVDEKRQELIHLYEMMNEENQEDQLAYARMRLEKQERENKNAKKNSGASQRV